MRNIIFFIDKRFYRPHNYAIRCIKDGRSGIGKPKTVPARTDTQIDRERSHFEPGRIAAAAGTGETSSHPSDPLARHCGAEAGENGGRLQTSKAYSRRWRASACAFGARGPRIFAGRPASR